MPSSNKFGFHNDKTTDSFDRMIELIRKVVEFKNLVGELYKPPLQYNFNYPTGFMPFTYNYRPQPVNFENTNSDNTIDSSLNSYSNVHFQAENLEIIGYKGCICNTCLVVHPLPIHVNKKGQNRIIETKHECNLERLENIIMLEESEYARILIHLHETLPQVMKKAVIDWTKGTTCLVAIQIDSAKDNCVDIGPIIDDNHWCMRAIKQKMITLDDAALSDFLNVVRNGTAAFFKVNLKEDGKLTTRFYWMAITDRKTTIKIESFLNNHYVMKIES
jgi:hypothetical protein